MTHMEMTALENASRTAMAWSPEGYDGRTRYDYVLKAGLPALAIVAVAALLLFVVF
ncbi:hypothetical protein [Arsenicitalea aurantiaca]|uniref:hypothetical protein n=1 Tax=Arsenicitalea aurantiaca TaxID=1783274 RepID=UPI0013151407|nr:hypothetical protein [Arsenicitalea aurantiaca]